jgi:hypothetical protein
MVAGQIPIGNDTSIATTEFVTCDGQGTHSRGGGQLEASKNLALLDGS